MEANLSREKLPADENIRVCNLHFEENWFEWDLRKNFKLLWNNFEKEHIYCDSSFAFNYRSTWCELFHKKNYSALVLKKFKIKLTIKDFIF